MNFLFSAVEYGYRDIPTVFRELFSAFRDFGPRDAVDILFLSALLFLTFRFIRGRKAGALIMGIAVCVVVWFVSFIFRLQAINYVFSGIFKIGAIAVVIIFQPEIRDALEKLGSGSMSGIMLISDQKKKRQLYYNAVQQVCLAVGDLAKTKTGALIVIERTTKLDDVIQTGVTINADVNSFLLRNLFFNKAPLHDGAVVIDDGRIAAAGCLLPLTRRSDIDSDLGTRHRAAIGLSETSDAITVVVSEETGIISVAYDCTLTRNYTPDSLRRFLNEKLLHSKTDADN